MEAMPKTVEEIFNDFKGRRAGLIKALTIDFDKFYSQCDPEKVNMCLYGLPNETWEVRFPVDKVPTVLPEPAIGINFARDGMQKKDWLSLVAFYSNSWLLSVAFYHGGRSFFTKNQRKNLFQMINDLPTIYEVLINDLPTILEEGEEDDEQGANNCGLCGEKYVTDEFWICCDVCDKWFHGECVNITPAEAKHIDKYKCPVCSSKRARV